MNAGTAALLAPAGNSWLLSIVSLDPHSLFEIWPAAPRCHIGPVRQIATDAAIAGKPAHGLLTGGLYG
jgi:hypothetical protein